MATSYQYLYAAPADVVEKVDRGRDVCLHWKPQQEVQLAVVDLFVLHQHLQGHKHGDINQ